MAIKHIVTLNSNNMASIVEYATQGKHELKKNMT